MGRRGPQPTWARDRNNEQVAGLVKRKDGRYAAHANPNTTFGKDRDDAIRRFRHWESRKRKTRIYIPERQPPSAAVVREWNEEFMGEPVPKEVLHYHGVPEAEFWDRVREELSERPKLAARKTGLEHLGYTDFKPPPPSATLDEIGKRYLNDKKGITPQEHKNSQTWWNEFKQITGVRTVADLSHDLFRAYRERVKADQLDGKRSNSYTRSRFGKITTIINHALSDMNLSPKDREILLLKSLLKKPPKPKSKPMDIEREELQAILKDADDFDRALILTALNCCFYPIDLVRLRWDMMNLDKGVLCFDREKSEHLAGSSVVRVAVLWPRTIVALKKLRNSETHVFVLGNAVMEHQTPNARFKRLVKKAGIQRRLTFGCLRDAGQTRAAELGVPMQQYQCLAGHKFPGVDDDYVRRNPNFVREACAAIERYYFG